MASNTLCFKLEGFSESGFKVAKVSKGNSPWKIRDVEENGLWNKLQNNFQNILETKKNLI